MGVAHPTLLVETGLLIEEPFVIVTVGNLTQKSHLNITLLEIILARRFLMIDESKVESKQELDGNGNLIRESYFQDGILNGITTLWSPDGMKIGESNYLNGALEGKSLIWNINGQLKQEAFFRNGVLHGPYSSWWDNGQKKEEGCYEDGERVGKYRWYSKDGCLQSEHDYTQDL